MGQCLPHLTGLTGALRCDSCAKYVCNSFRVHSKCGECCELDVETDEISIKNAAERLEEQAYVSLVDLGLEMAQSAAKKVKNCHNSNFSSFLRSFEF